MIDEVYQWVASQVEKHRPASPVLEVGSYDVNGSIRDLFDDPYVGVDLRDGPGVDVVMDFSESVMEPIFNTLVCCETLEHCKYVLDVLTNIRMSGAPGALFIGTWPFIFDVHDYPSDYWRVTPEGFRAALEGAGFVDIEVDRPWHSHVVATARVPETGAVAVTVEVNEGDSMGLLQ